jgi:hypothetical protein
METEQINAGKARAHAARSGAKFGRVVSPRLATIFDQIYAERVRQI